MRRFKNSGLLLIIIIGVIPLLDLFHFGLPLTHDGQDHVARIANFYQNLSEGNIIPRWAGNLNWGYGHPILMFLYPLPSYIASLFHFIGFSLVDSVKIVFGLGFIASGLAMYLWLKEFLGTKAGFIGAILYMFAPYRFVDLYVRGAIGEHVAFIFPPLVFYFMLKISQLYRHSGKGVPDGTPAPRISQVVRDSGQARMTVKYWFIIGGSLSFSGILLSHNAISLMFMPLIFLYALYLTFTSEESKSLLRHLRGGKMSLLGSVGLIMFLGFGLSAFFLIPAFFEGKYTLRDIVTSGGHASSFVNNFKHFVYGGWSYGGTGVFSVQIGIAHWLLVIVAIPITYFLFKKRNKLWIFPFALLIIFFFSLFIMMPSAKFIWENITLLQKFQFPWRFLSVTVFVSSVIGALVVYSLSDKVKTFGVFILVLAVLFFNKDYWHAKDYLVKPESFFTGIYNSTTDTGESSPIWSVRFMEKRPKAHIEVISGEAAIKEISRKPTVHFYEIAASKRSRIVENTLYFPGWEVFVDERKIDIEFQDPLHRGLMTFFVEKGKHNLEIKFGETKLRLFADIISVASFIPVFVSGIWKSTRPKGLNQTRNLQLI